MAPPNMVLLKLRAVHAAAIQAGLGGQKIEKRAFERIIAPRLGLTTPALKRWIETGTVHGLWEPVKDGSKKGALRILEPKHGVATSSATA